MKILLLACLFSYFVCVCYCEESFDEPEYLNETDEIDASGSGSGSWDMEEEDQPRKKRTNEEPVAEENKSTPNVNATEVVPAKKTDISNGQKAKGLTSNTEVSVPASVISKVFGSTNGSLTNTPDQSTSSTIDKVPTSVEALSAPVEEESEKRGVLAGMKPKPIGPMEKLEITIEGKASTKRNFTKSVNEKEGDIPIPEEKKVDFLQEKEDKPAFATMKKQNAHKRTKSHKRKTRKSKIAFPKIILYQGPLSKAIEKMLYSRSSDEKKRSQIEKLFRGAKSGKKLAFEKNVEEENNESEESSEDDNDDSDKKSNVGEKKYKVKGFVDNVRVDSTATKKSTTEKVLATKKGDEPSEKKARPSIVENDEIMRQNVNNLINTPAYSRSLTKSKTKSKPLKKPKKFVNSASPKLKVQPNSETEDDEDEEVSGEDENEKKPPLTGEMDLPKKHKDTFGLGEEKEEDEDEEGDGDDDGSAPAGTEPKPMPVEEATPSLPEETSNSSNAPISPDSGNSVNPFQYPPSHGDSNAGNDSGSTLPEPVQNLPSPPSIGLPPQVPNLPPPEVSPEENPDLPKEGPEDQTFVQEDMMTQLDMNTQRIDTLISTVSNLEAKERELESAMGSISEGLERIENKIDSQQQKQSISAFNKVVTPSDDDINSNNNRKRPTLILDILKKIYETFSNRQSPIMDGRPVHRRPKVLKEIFIPLPPKGSDEAQAIEHGKLFNSPVLSRLPLPIKQIVSNIFRQQLQKEDGGVMTIHPPSASIDPDEPAKEHDIDKLELSLGRIPISRHGGTFHQAPKLIFFAKAPKFMELLSRPCDQPCQNGGHCLGNNVCRCYHGFTGPQCQHRLRPTLVEIIGPSPVRLFKQPIRNMHQISLPFVPTEFNDGSDEDNNKQRTMGHVDQSKLVNILRKFTLPLRDSFNEGEADNFEVPFIKRYDIPRRYDKTIHNPYNNYHNRRYYRYY